MKEIAGTIEFILIVGGFAYWIDMFITIKNILTEKDNCKENK